MHSSCGLKDEKKYHQLDRDNWAKSEHCTCSSHATTCSRSDATDGSSHLRTASPPGMAKEGGEAASGKWPEDSTTFITRGGTIISFFLLGIWHLRLVYPFVALLIQIPVPSLRPFRAECSKVWEFEVFVRRGVERGTTPFVFLSRPSLSRYGRGGETSFLLATTYTSCLVACGIAVCL